MTLPLDLVPLADVVAKLPGKTERDLRQLSRSGRFPDFISVGGTAYVRKADLDVWERGAWESMRVALEEARFRHSGLAPMTQNRRASKKGA